jgi:hypothetical protein
MFGGDQLAIIGNGDCRGFIFNWDISHTLTRGNIENRNQWAFLEIGLRRAVVIGLVRDYQAAAVSGQSYLPDLVGTCIGQAGLQPGHIGLKEKPKPFLKL